ncbi:response regulator transcription factor [Erysipelothrix sp. HDW6C]|uniref:response regulator transcription factor n=1 Tax=Erysipelothrix sp. HDW6C TaxID=2714930 RepID=UPI00140DB44A|nr:response regulator transcription factor [Erysipelothrix sp. HDW6C]QIK69144.1 response regulator transcription factor [Erysipelothrix sp. HDW6C]
MFKIMMIEDDRDYANFLKERLLLEGYSVDAAHSAAQGLEYLAQNKYDLLISDLHLDVLNGIRLAATAKKMNPRIKTVILTAKPSDDSELESVTLNVDMYLEKNKSIKLILIYIAQLLESQNDSQRDIILTSSVENLEMNVRARTVLKDDTPQDLTPIEFAIVQFFLENKNIVMSRDEIIQNVWGNDSLEDERKVDVHIRNLRAKLDIFSIFTVRGIGYKWNEQE